VSVDQASGMIVPTGALSAGANYGVTSDIELDNLLQLSSSALPATSPPPQDLQLPGSLRSTLSKVVSAFGQETGQTTGAALLFLEALARDFQQNYGLSGTPPPGAPTVTASPSGSSPTSAGAAVSSTAPSATGSAPGDVSGGTSFADVADSVINQRSATPEQYATMFALVARSIGVPARVVTGFQIPNRGHGTTVPAGRYQLTPRNAYTWVEIPVRDVGWVVVDTAPAQYANGVQKSEGVQASASQAPTQSPNALVTQSNGGHAPAPPSTVHHANKHARAIWPWIVAGVAALVLLLLLILLLPKFVRRRRRRRRNDPRLRLVGAWQEGLDVLAESGLTELAGLTKTEIANDTRARFGDIPAAHALALGQAADTAIFSTQTRVSDPDADAAWHTEAELRRSVRRELSLSGRLASAMRYKRADRPHRVVTTESWSETGEPGSPRRRRWRRRHTH